MSDIWCYKMDCLNNGGYSGEDKNGKFGICLDRNIIVDRNGKCDSYNYKKDMVGSFNGKDKSAHKI